MELLREISHELKSSYIDYAMSVIVGRALPDARDGLKPVQRRILYAMYEMGLRSNRPHRKCARIVGDVLGKYHPHGDAAVYDALVRMAQDFSMRYPMIDGQGNFGSIDGDSAAAMRYTEARLAKIAEEMLTDIEKETVDFIPNFDATLNEPVVLPSGIPNLLINGGSGIAVGMATNIPPHNLVEICDAIIAFIRDPEITVRELMNYVKGPDFPTGGIIVGRQGIIDAYETGRGKITVRGKIDFEDESLIIKEIPYMVNKAKLVEKIAELIRDGKLEEAKTVRDESDREGIRIVLELRGSAQTTINKLYTFTNLQTTFGVINLALINGEPKILNLKDLISEYISHRREVIRRRTQFDLKKAEERLHIVEGLRKAVSDIDNVVQLIKQSESPEKARSALIEAYDLSEVQANAILQMRLQKLTGIEIDTLENEYKELLKMIKNYREILAHAEKIDEIIIEELENIKEKYGGERKTEITLEEKEITIEELVASEDNLLVLTENGLIKRMDIGTFKRQQRGGVGIIGFNLKENDLPSILTVCNTRHKLLFFTDAGKAYWNNAYEISKQERLGKGVNIRRYIGINEDEKVVSIISTPDFSGEAVILNEDGHVKRVILSEFENAKRAGIISSSGKILDTKLCDGDEIIISTKNGQLIRFKTDRIPVYGRTAAGVKSIKLKEDDEIACLAVVRGDGDIFTLTEKGYGKRTPVEKYRLTSRGSMGVINIKVSEKTGKVVLTEYVEGDEDLLIFSNDGYALKVAVGSISRQGRAASGVRVCRKEVACATLIK
ncbi:MAG TPA: DNA gyrase subunit A [Archaeoglobaceae archaeon]|nr:DNA gyrase subunit A [Archaeoglobaceae archaeon]